MFRFRRARMGLGAPSRDWADQKFERVFSDVFFPVSRRVMSRKVAGMDLRGKETDWIMWDSSMTEKPAFFNNFFMRQALIVSSFPFLYTPGIALWSWRNFRAFPRAALPHLSTDRPGTAPP